MKAPAFQLYAADFYMDTVSWSPEMVGVYTRLLFYQWVNGSIPDDIEKIARIGGCLDNRKWKANTARMWLELCTKFVTLPDGNLVNLRLEETRRKQELYSESQKEKGKKRAEKMWEGHIAGAKPIVQPKDSSSSSSSIITPIVPKKGTVYCDDFLLFWNGYPKKIGKDAAWKAWQKRNGDRPEIGIVIGALLKQKESPQWKRDNGQYIPNPTTWLNQGRWADEVEGKKESW